MPALTGLKNCWTWMAKLSGLAKKTEAGHWVNQAHFNLSALKKGKTHTRTHAHGNSFVFLVPMILVAHKKQPPLGRPGRHHHARMACNLFPLVLLLYPPNIPEVTQTRELVWTHILCTHIYTRNHILLLATYWNLSPASAPLTVGEGKNPSPPPWDCVNLSQRWVTAVGLLCRHVPELCPVFLNLISQSLLSASRNQLGSRRSNERIWESLLEAVFSFQNKSEGFLWLRLFAMRQ